MKLWSVLTNAAQGWAAILRGDLNWRRFFTLSAPGLVTALFLFTFVLFLAVAFTSMSMGMPGTWGIIAAMLVLSLPVLSLLLALLGTRLMLRSDAPLLDVLVPGTYGLIAFVIAEGLLAIIGGPVIMLSWLLLAFLLFRVVRLAYGWAVGVSAAFAILTTLLLVAMRYALYMLSYSASSPL